MKLSIIIPTYNRKHILKLCLKALEKQNTSKKDFEVIVIDDGSTGGTFDYIKETIKQYSFSLRIFRQKNQGQGIARNFGLKKAKGSIILFIGDDIIPDKNFLKEHLAVHNLHPELSAVCLGRIEWHPDLNITPFMRWLSNGSSILGKFGGHQFAYEKLDGKFLADYNFFYTSNISLKKELLKEELFDPDFCQYGWEDIELGYRLEKKHGLKLYYNKDALAYHHHVITEDSLKTRMQLIGKSAHIIDKKHPELNKAPSPIKKLILQCISSRLSLVLLKIISKFSSHRILPYYYYALSKKYFLDGIREGDWGK